jgi:excisionase family DNA binding protein
MVTRAPKTDILLIKDVAEYLEVNERTIYRLAAAKKIPAFKVGGSWRFSRADINAWIKALRLQSRRLARNEALPCWKNSNNSLTRLAR